MVPDCQIILNLNGAFMHPLTDQPRTLDFRYVEEVATIESPIERFLDVSAVQDVDFGGIKNPRAVIVHNITGSRLQTFPSDEEKAILERSVLRYGLGGGRRDGRLLPALPGARPGGTVALWIGPGASVQIAPETEGLTVSVRLLILPGQSTKT